MDKIEKPPIGLEPRWAHDGRRKVAILEAMERYAKAKLPIPLEWIEELEDLLSL